MGLLNEVDIAARELENAKQRALNALARECAKYKNDKIKYISKKPRIFTIKFSDLELNWSPDYYDFEYQFKVIIHVLNHTNPDNLLNKWNEIKNKGVARFLPSIVREYNLNTPYAEITKELKQDWYDTNYVILKFHPKVVKFVDSLI